MELVLAQTYASRSDDACSKNRVTASCAAVFAPAENVSGVNDARSPFTSPDGRGHFAPLPRAAPLRGICGGGIRAAAAAALLAASAPRDASRRGLLPCFAAEGRLPGVEGAKVTLAAVGVAPPALNGDAPKEALPPGVEPAGVAIVGVAALGVAVLGVDALGLGAAAGATTGRI